MQLSNEHKRQFTVFKVSETKKKIFLNDKYIITPLNKYFHVVEYYVQLLNKKNKLQIFQESMGINLFSYLELFLKNQQQRQNNPSFQMNPCKICLDDFEEKPTEDEVQDDADTDLYLLPCNHILHKRCIFDHMPNKSFLKCPYCEKMVGFIFGNMPDGIMTHQIDEELTCPGQKPGTIIIEYQMFGGERDGQVYQSKNFIAYIPLGGHGHQVLYLLQEAFRRKLTFTISRNKNKENEIEWGKISHKTNLHGGSRNSGFPDDKFFDKIRGQLRMHGLQMI